MNAARTSLVVRIHREKGRRAKDPQGTLDAMLYVTRTGCPRSGLPSPAGSLAGVGQRRQKMSFREQLMNAWVDVPGEAPPAGGIPFPALDVRECTAQGDGDAAYREETHR